MMLNINSAQPSTYFPLRINKSQETQPVVPIQFPSTRNVLWESKPVGDIETLSLTLHKQDVQLSVVEKTLRLAQRYSEGSNSTSFLLGSIYAKSDEGGVCFGVDRFDPGREVTEKIGDIVSKCKVPTAVVPGDHIIPIKVKYDPSSPEDSLSHTKDEFSRSLQIMVAKISGKESLTLSHIISLKANLYCVENDDEVILNLHCGAIVPDVKFQAQLIAPLPIIPTALARNLAGSLSLKLVPKMGYITMDQTRKLLLFLESDPKAYSLPLIGIWISGVYSVHHSYVWACCLRYLNCTEIKDRVLHSSGSFLLLHYSVVQRLPDFWECRSNEGENLNFELLSCQEELNIDLRECNSKDLLWFYLSPAADGINKTLFDEALNEWNNQIQVSRGNETSTRRRSLNIIPPGSPGVINDETPRPSPSPHPSPTQGETIYPPVPEDSLSLSFDDMANTFNQEDLKNRKESRKKLAPHFNGSNKGHSMKPFNSENSLKPSRQPFKQISSQTPERAQNIPRERVRSNPPAAKTQMIGGKGDKENTPLISRSVGNVKYSRKPMNTERRRSHVTKTDKVVLNHSPSAQHEKEQQQSDREDNIRAQSKKPSRVSQDFPNNSNDRNVTLSEPRLYSGDNHPSCSPHEIMRPQADLLETNQVYPAHFEKMHSNHSSIGSSNEGNVGDISADSSSCENCEDRVNDRKIIVNRKICEVASPLNNSCNFTEQVILQQQGSAERIKHSQKEEPDEHQSPGNATLQEKAVERETGDLSNGRLQEQVKRQDDMIRVLQEQVRSLLKTKEAMSSPGHEPSLPMTPASTPESNDGRILKLHTEKQNQSVSSLAVQTDDGVIALTPDVSKAKSVTVGVNTGVSLLWNEPPQNKSRCARYCECNYSSRNSKPEVQSPSFPKAEDSNDKLTPEKSESLENLSDVAVQDESNQSLPLTFNTVDIPSFDESGSAAADQNSYEKKCSFGESASVVSNQSSRSSCSEECSQSDAVSVKGREFYDKLLHQVKDLLSEQVNDESDSESSRLKSCEEKVKEKPPALATVPTREIVVKATLQELEKIKRSEHERPGSSSSIGGRVPGGSSILQTYQRSMSTSFIPDHPRLNYISMLVDETFDEVAYLDEVTLKYLSDEEINVFKNELHPAAAGTVKRSFTRTVRFGSVPNVKERKSPSKEVRSLREVDFTWNNLSLCTKNYLTKYNLVEKHISFCAQDEEDKSGENVDREPSKEDPQESFEVPCRPPFPSPVRKSSGDKNTILDIRRLKNLPKLF